MKYDFPRWVGNPSQRVVKSREDFVNFLKDNNGKKPCYTRHNGYVTHKDVKIRYVPWDFDAKEGEKLENALLDSINHYKWAEASGLCPVVVFTGGRGFHNYIEFKPSTVIINQNLKDTYRAIQNTAYRQCKFRHMDHRIVSDVVRLMRVVNVKYCDKFDKLSGYYSVEIPRDMLMSGNLDAIKEYANKPQPPVKTNPVETFVECVNRLEIKPENKNTTATTQATQFASYSSIDDDFVKALLPRPCIHQSLMTNNPPHMVRFEACSSLVDVNYDYMWLVKFFRSVADKAGWVDRHNEGVLERQVYSIYRKKGAYDMHSCDTLRNSGLCIGESCPFFERAFPGEVKK